MKFLIVWILSFLHLCSAQTEDFGNGRGFIHRRPRPIHQQSSSPCWNGGSSAANYDSVEEDAEGRKYFLAAGAAVGGAVLGYHLGMKHKNPVIINNNIHNDYPPPCVVVQHGGGAGGVGGGGLVSGILGHHPILSSILQGGLWNGGGGGGANRLPLNRENNINWNRAIRQFNRVVRPLSRGFK